MWPDAARRNITRANFERFTAGLAPDLRIMDLMDSQPEFTKSIWDYLDILVNDTRIAKGREVLAKYKPQFDAVEKLYGVDRYIIASIWGVESNYSTQMGDRSVLQSTATLASAAARNISGTSSYRRWKSSTAATCARSRCAAHGPARSGRRNSCRPRSSATRWTPTATAAATWSTMPPT
jgi:membrane-bound lytic murein transglycosylase B